MQVNFHEGFLDQDYADASAKVRKQYDSEEAELEKKFPDDPRRLAEEKRKHEAAYEARLPRPDFRRIADHIDHAVKLAGVDHVGLGSDFDGARMPRGMEDASHLPALTAELMRRGYSETDLMKILGGNVLRVMEQVEGVARQTAGH